MNYKSLLASILSEIHDADKRGDYETRNREVYYALAMASILGYEVGFRIDAKEPEWPVAFIELPTGQISYHLPQHVNAWDEHDADEKNKRLMEYVVSAVVSGDLV
jgi:hypothetical protein